MRGYAQQAAKMLPPPASPPAPIPGVPPELAASIQRAIRAQGGLAIGAHPVNTRKTEKQTYGLWHRREELAPELDAWEVASGRRTRSEFEFQFQSAFIWIMGTFASRCNLSTRNDKFNICW
jgi:hypothetical protein